MNNQKGFTLIELIVVIVILGILAAVALPKFIDLTSDARRAKIQGATGALQSAAALAHAKWLVAPSTATIEGVPVTWVNGYPSAGTIAALAGMNVTTDYAATVAAPTATFRDFASPLATCQVVYTEATATAGASVAQTVTTC